MRWMSNKIAWQSHVTCQRIAQRTDPLGQRILLLWDVSEAALYRPSTKRIRFGLGGVNESILWLDTGFSSILTLSCSEYNICLNNTWQGENERARGGPLKICDDIVIVLSTLLSYSHNLVLKCLDVLDNELFVVHSSLSKYELRTWLVWRAHHLSRKVQLDNFGRMDRTHRN